MQKVNEQTAFDMIGARNKTSFDVHVVRHFVHHDQEKWEKRKKIRSIIESDPSFDKSNRDFLNRTERYNHGLSMINRMSELQEARNLDTEDLSIAFSMLGESLPISLHLLAFEPVFKMQASPSLLGRYGDLISTRGILGCYLQTELGHGTNVSRLETTATYIPETRQFDLHSPTLTSSKWWIGALGRTATHGVVQARLILSNGKDVGPHLFFVQLRSMDDHKPLPGIVIGDIGPKVMNGFSATDNGFAHFDHVRIPKENMLSKFAQVTDEGQYIQPPHTKLSYAGMLYIRSSMVTTAGWALARASTIAIRYATVRRQGEVGVDGLEQQVITYPSTYYRLLPILSRAYVFIELGRFLTYMFEQMASRLATGDTSQLAEMHAITSGLKVLVTTSTIQDIETARRSMGGHGYSAFSGLGRLYADYLPAATYEGDNFVLDQQVVRTALKSFKSLRSDRALPLSSKFLRHLNDSTAIPEASMMDFTDLDNSILLLEWRAAFIVQEFSRNEFSPDPSACQRVSRAVTEAFVAVQVGEIMKGLKLPGKEAGIITNLYTLFLLTTVEAGLVDLLSFGLFNSRSSGRNVRDPTIGLRLSIKKTCESLLPDAIGLTDSFGFSDWELDSALGVYDGKVYEALWVAAQKEPLNQTEVPVAYETSIKHILQRGQRLARQNRSKL